ncbi:MAG: SAF domain-containing protein [Lachnospiraceae bacterium]|nr:SAF domain-containing protein [Lachnospiraceae bacterium]
MRRSLNRYSFRRSVVILLCILVVFYIMATVYGYYSWQACSQEREKLDERLSLYEKKVYVAAKKLSKGTILSEDLLDWQIRYSDYAQDKFISEDDFGKSLSLDIEEGTCLMDFMVCSTESNTRMFYLEEVDVPKHVQEGDRVDIRIRYGNAEEYIVLSDKIVVNLQEEHGMVLCLTEEEFLLISSAIIDTELFRPAKLYVVEYPEYESVENSPATYIANQDVLLLLGREKTEGESRAALEQRLLQN